MTSTATPSPPQASRFGSGQAVPRLEDAQLLRGEGLGTVLTCEREMARGLGQGVIEALAASISARLAVTPLTRWRISALPSTCRPFGP